MVGMTLAADLEWAPRGRPLTEQYFRGIPLLD